MKNGWRSFRQSVDDTTATIRAVIIIIGIISGIITILGKWFQELNTIQQSAIVIVGVCLLIIGITYVFDWQRKRSIDKIPELLSKLDQMTFEYIDKPKSESPTPERLLDDLAILAGMNIGPLKAAAKSKDTLRTESEMKKFSEKYEKFGNMKKLDENLMTLRLMGGVMNDYNEGLGVLTKNKEYQKILLYVKKLQKRLPSAEISIKINEYFHVSEGLYSLILSISSFSTLGGYMDIIPAKTRAYTRVVRPIVEGHLNTLISSVRESIEKYKNKEPQSLPKREGK